VLASTASLSGRAVSGAVRAVGSVFEEGEAWTPISVASAGIEDAITSRRTAVLLVILCC
jgi:hypothetical protein